METKEKQAGRFGGLSFITPLIFFRMAEALIFYFLYECD